MNRKLDPKYLEDLSDFFVSTTAKRPREWKVMQGVVNDCERRFSEGDILAVHDALLACERGSLPLPGWLMQAVKYLWIASLSGGLEGKKGRANSPLGKAKNRLKKEVHYRTVEMVLQISRSIDAELFVATLVGPRSIDHVFPARMRELIGDSSNPLSKDSFRVNLTGAYETSSVILRGTFAQAEPRTIRSSYNYVKREFESVGGRSYHDVNLLDRADPETLDALGLNVEMSEVEMYAYVTGTELIEPEPETPEFFLKDGSPFIQVPDEGS